MTVRYGKQTLVKVWDAVQFQVGEELLKSPVDIRKCLLPEEVLEEKTCNFVKHLFAVTDICQCKAWNSPVGNMSMPICSGQGMKCLDEALSSISESEESGKVDRTY